MLLSTGNSGDMARSDLECGVLSLKMIENGGADATAKSQSDRFLQMRDDPRAVEASFGNSGHPVIRRAVTQGAGDDGRVAAAFEPEHLVVAVGAEAFHGTGVDS